MQPGDVISSKRDDGGYRIMKILKIDTHPVGKIYHCLSYQPTPTEPSSETIGELIIYFLHMPIAELPADAHVLFNMPVLEYELEGYREYEKHMQKPWWKFW